MYSYFNSFMKNSKNIIKNQFETNENQITKKKNINIQLEIFTEILSKKESKTRCICHNHIKDIENKKNVFIEKELIPKLEINYIEDSNNNKFFINLQCLSNKLKELGFPLEGSNLSIFHPFFNVYVPFGIEPFDQNVLVDSDYIYNDFIQIKIVNFIESSLIEKSFKEKENKKLIENDNKNYINNLRNKELISIDEEDEYYDKLDISEDYESEDEEELNMVKEEIEEINNNNSSINNSTIISTDINQLSNNNNKKSMSRRRERRIEYIIEKVLLWRKYMNGLYINGIFEKYDSKKAAKIVGVSKKSLDDYTKLIRIGRKLNYNFNKNRNKRISDLKSFIKKNL